MRKLLPLIFPAVLFFSGCQGTIFTEISKPYQSNVSRDVKPVIEDKKDQPVPRVYVYQEKSPSFKAYIPSGWMGDWKDVIFDDAWVGGVSGSKSCIKIEYVAHKSQGLGWAGLYWQYPANNWGGVKDGGRDLRGAKRLVFWAKGEKGGEVISEFVVGGIRGKYFDTTRESLGPVVLTKDWQRYEISLKGNNLKRVSGGFAWTANLKDNPAGATFYLDDVYYEWQ